MKSITIFVIVGAICVTLTGCSTFVTPRYSVFADTNLALKKLAAADIAVGEFKAPADFKTLCRGAGPLGVADGLTHATYIRRAFEQELKMAGAFAEGAPKVTITGDVTKMAFSSTRSITGGSWDIELTLSSSNGSTFTVSEHYEFKSGFVAETACKQTAEAFFPAVQNLVLKAVSSPDFRRLIDPSEPNKTPGPTTPNRRGTS